MNRCTLVLALVPAALCLAPQVRGQAGLKPPPAKVAAARRAGIEATRAGRWQEARHELDEALKGEPNQPEALYALALCLAQAGENQAALSSLAAALKAGFQDYHALESDPGLKPLRSLGAFHTLVRA